MNKKGVNLCYIYILTFLSIVLISSNLSFAEKMARIINIRPWTNPKYTRIVIDIDGKVEFKEHRLINPERFYIDILNAIIDPKLMEHPIPINDSIVKRIRTGQQKDAARIVLDINNINRFKVFSLDDPSRIIIDLWGTPIPGTTLPDTEKKGEEINREESVIEKDRGIGDKGKELVHKIVIDPGHGGKDPGAIGKGGIEEKNVVLDIAKRLKGIMEKEGNYKVILTREKDVFIPLEERTFIANEKEADIFISIHTNASDHSLVNGIETYYLSNALSKRAFKIAARENMATQKSVNNDVQFILADMKANSKINESVQLASTIQTSLVNKLSKTYSEIMDLRIKGGPFYVLYGADMPSVLIETSFISNPAEERRLCNKNY
ncbi:MAG: N-acetylmuramoyl-L-alanine amidase, partial [Nitrospinae bacterium]|nr:N-acetylmuramoyl-L-alanine amidase [Nitrospinota bacterium]